jgi:hypothetical protein
MSAPIILVWALLFLFLGETAGAVRAQTSDSSLYATADIGTSLTNGLGSGWIPFLFGAGVGLQQDAWRIEGSIKGFHVRDMMGYDNSCRVICGMAYLRFNLSSTFVSSSRLLFGSGVAHLKTKSYVGRHDEEHYDGYALPLALSYRRENEMAGIVVGFEQLISKRRPVLSLTFALQLYRKLST